MGNVVLKFLINFSLFATAFIIISLSLSLSLSHSLSLSLFHAVVLPKSLGALTDGSVETPAMHPTPTVGRPPGQRGRKPGRRKTKVTVPWGQKASALGPQGVQPSKDHEPIKIPKKRGPKPGNKVGVKGFEDPIRDRHFNWGGSLPKLKKLIFSSDAVDHWIWNVVSVKDGRNARGEYLKMITALGVVPSWPLSPSLFCP